MRFYYILVALVIFSHKLSSTESIIKCTAKNIEFQGRENYSTWPWSATAILNGEAIKTWMPEEEDPINMECVRQGGSSMAPWWLCQKNFAENKLIHVTFWKRYSQSQVKIKLIENNEIVSTYEPLCGLSI